MRRGPIMLMFCLALLPIAAAVAQSCNSAAPVTSPAERFRDNGDGTVTDQSSELIWSRCSLGQQWHDKHCVGQPRPQPWNTAVLLARDGWRLPELHELTGLAELQCVRPAINLQLFPNTPPAAYWTATRFVNRDEEYWQVLFLQGASIPEQADAVAFVRLVRDGVNKR